MPAVAATNPPVLIATGRGRDVADPGRLRRRDAAQPRAAGGGRAVRAARGGVPGPDRPRHRPGARQRPGDQLRAAARRRWRRATRRSARFPEYVDNVLAMMEPDGVGLDVAGPHLPAARRPRSRRSVPDRSGCSAPRTTRPGWPPRRGCPTSSPTTSPAAAPPRRSRSTATSFRPVARARRAAHLPHRQRRGRRVRRGGRAAGAAAAAGDGGAAHRRRRSGPSGWSRRPRRLDAARRRTRTWSTRCAARWVIGARPTGRARGSSELAATYGVDEVMVHPVAGAHAGTDPDRSPGPRGDAPAARQG